MDWKTWLKSLAAVAIGGAASGAAQAVQSGGTVNKSTAVTAGIGALSTVLAYLMRSPLATVSLQQPADPATPEAKPSGEQPK